MISEALSWWVDGLASALLGLERRIRRQRRFRLDCTTWPLVLVPLNGSRAGATGSITVPDPASTEFFSEIRHRTRGSVFEIVIPSAALLERQLDPLPRESAPYIESVVRHQIEAIFPWSAKDVLHTTLVKNRADGRIDVSVRATSRAAVDPALSIATACEASQVLVVGSGDKYDHNLRPILIFLGKEASARVERARSAARYAIGALLVIGICSVGWTTFARWSAARDLAAIEQAIADRRALLMRASASHETAGRGGLEARKRQGPLAVLVLERLSDVLPDDTYLTDLNLEGERLRISGVSGQAAELVPLLEKSGLFRNASFYAPTTRMAGTSTDRFSIEAMINTQLGAKR
jgi:general secretion pathway protein L